MSTSSMKKLILAAISDSVAGFLYYDRRDDVDLKLGVIEKAVLDGAITIKEITEHFESELTKSLYE